MVGCATPPFSRSALVTTLGTSHFAITQLSSHPAPALPQALPRHSTPSPPASPESTRCGATRPRAVGRESQTTTSWDRLRSGACLLPQAAAAAHRPSSGFEFTAALSPLGLGDGEGGQKACSAAAADRIALSGSPDAFVRKQLAPTLRRRRQGAAALQVSMMCGARCLVWLPAAPAVPFAAAGSLNYRGLRLLRRPFLAGASASASCVLSRPRLFLLRLEGGQDPERACCQCDWPERSASAKSPFVRPCACDQAHNGCHAQYRVSRAPGQPSLQGHRALF